MAQSSKPSPDSWRNNSSDLAATIAAWAFLFWTWINDRRISDRIADVEVPHGFLIPIMIFARIGQLRRDRALAHLRESVEEISPILTNRMRESDDRQTRLVDLQASLEQMARDGEERDGRRHLTWPQCGTWEFQSTSQQMDGLIVVRSPPVVAVADAAR